MNETNNNHSSANETINDQEQMLVTFKRIVEGYLLFSVCIIGLIGNIVTCISILSSRSRRSSPTHINIVALTITSTFVLAGFFLTHGIRSSFGTFGEFVYRRTFTRVFPPHVTCLLIQIYLTATIAVDRFLLICCWKTLSYKKWRTPRHALLIIAIVTLFCIIYCLPFWFEYKLIDNEYIELSSFGAQPVFRLLMRKYLYFIFVFLLPLSLTIVCSLLMVKQLYQLSKRKQKYRTGRLSLKKSSKRTNRLLLSIIIVALATQLPYFIFNVLYSLHGPHLMENVRARVYLSINNLLSTLNASSTFVLYAVFAQKEVVPNRRR